MVWYETDSLQGIGPYLFNVCFPQASMLIFLQDTFYYFITLQMSMGLLVISEKEHILREEIKWLRSVQWKVDMDSHWYVLMSNNTIK